MTIICPGGGNIPSRYQLAPLKQAMLRRCRSSADCLAGDQGQAAWPAARHGARHGLACLARCGTLMGLLFAGGVMNLLWIALIALWVFAEKNLSWGGRLARLSGAALMAWGAIALARALWRRSPAHLPPSLPGVRFRQVTERPLPQPTSGAG